MTPAQRRALAARTRAAGRAGEIRAAARARRIAAARAAADRRAAEVALRRRAAAARAESVRQANARAAALTQPDDVTRPFLPADWMPSLPQLPLPRADATAPTPEAVELAQAADARRRVVQAAQAAQAVQAAQAAQAAQATRAAAPGQSQTTAAQPAQPSMSLRTYVRRSPDRAAASHYLRSLVGTSRDVIAMRRLGYRDARAHASGRSYLVLLDIGGQTPTGVRLSTTTRHLSYAQLVTAVNAYIDGYAHGQRRNAPAEITIGTNNDLFVSRAAGRLWASQVVDPVRGHAQPHADIAVSGADDIEPGFAAGPRATMDWVRGYLEATSAGLVVNGSADGCSPSHPWSGCDRGWTMKHLAWIAGMASPARISALPQIYNRTMAGQWAQIARTAASFGQHLRILGPLTENAACGQDPSCPTMPSRSAWVALWLRLNGYPETRVASLPVQSDLDVN